MATKTTGQDFIRQIIRNDLELGKNAGRICTRFPPEPNGYLHIGHALSICLNFGVAKDFDGECFLRFDDTNPAKETTDFVEAIIKDVAWLGFDWGDRLTHASDYFDDIYDYAIELIEDGHAYVDSQSGDEIKQTRGTLSEPGTDSPYRNRSVAENTGLFERMRSGEFDNGENVLRAKIDMGSPNINLRDPIIYRILHLEHQRTGNKWCIYPMYDFAHTIKINTSDIIDDNLILDHSVKECAKEDHYTVLTMTNHWPERKWPANTQKKVKKYLASIYKYFILDKELTITWGESGLLQPKVLLIAKRDTDQTEYKWIIDDAEGEGAETADGEKKRITVKGWLALLEPHTTAASKGLDKSLCSGRSNAGISIYRRKRMIQGYPDAWLPGCIFGEENPGTNNTVNQRVFGELLIDAAKVSQDKASITHEDLDIIEEYLKLEYKEKSIRATALVYVSEGEKPTKDKSKQAVKKVKKKLQESDIPMRITDQTPKAEILDSETKNLFAMLKNEEKEKLKIGHLTVNLIATHKPSSKEEYMAIDPVDSTEITIAVNMNHPFVENWVTNLPQYIEDCVFDGLAYWESMKANVNHGRAIAYKKDALLRYEREAG